MSMISQLVTCHTLGDTMQSLHLHRLLLETDVVTQLKVQEPSRFLFINLVYKLDIY